MPDRDVSTIRDLIYYRYAKITAKSALAASDGREGCRLKHRGDEKFDDSIPPLLEKRSTSRLSPTATTAQARSTKATWTGTR